MALHMAVPISGRPGTVVQASASLDMAEELSAPGRPVRTARVGAAVMATVGGCFTVLLFGLAGFVAAFLVSEHELDSAWPAVAWIAALGAISGAATIHLVRRIKRAR